MAPKLKRLSGQEVVTILKQFGFSLHSQKGSHIKLRRIGPAGERQALTIAAHEELDTGTLFAIFRQASRYLPEDKLRSHFYTE